MATRRTRSYAAVIFLYSLVVCPAFASSDNRGVQASISEFSTTQNVGRLFYEAMLGKETIGLNPHLGATFGLDDTTAAMSWAKAAMDLKPHLGSTASFDNLNEAILWGIGIDPSTGARSVK